ncbi:MAG: hypothetical protein IPK58_12800 [Acidobacteria bacterium]|nr:hypothetical protein [Acidobacteriota bacterium]
MKTKGAKSTQKAPFTVKITAPVPSLQKNFEVKLESGETQFLTGNGALMEIAFVSLDGVPLKGVKVTESPKVEKGAVGAGETLMNRSEGVTDSNGTVQDMVMNAVYGAALPEPFGTPLAGSNLVLELRRMVPKVTAAPTLDQIQDKLKEPYHSPQTQTLAVTLNNGSRYAVVFTRTLSNLDKEGKGGATYTLSWSSASITRVD